LQAIVIWHHPFTIPELNNSSFPSSKSTIGMLRLGHLEGNGKDCVKKMHFVSMVQLMMTLDVHVPTIIAQNAYQNCYTAT
jgi:hypothetical protein